MNKALFFIGISALTISLSACDSPTENRREEAREDKANVMDEQADVVRERGDADANAIERRADDQYIKKNTEDAADSTREGADVRADAIEDQADELRDQN